MSKKTTAFYRGNTEVSVEFSAEQVSSDGAVVLLDKFERKHKLVSRISAHIPDQRDPAKVTHSVEKLLRQRVFTLMQGYEDCNDVQQLKNDPLFADILGGQMASQPTLSRFENSVDKRALFELCFSDRLSNHSYWANFMRLLISCLAYELFILLRQAIGKTAVKAAHTWQISTIRTRLLKVGATIHKTKRRICYRLSKSFVHQRLFTE